jgi:hypothetical protein
MVVDCCVWLSTLYTQSQFTDNLKKKHNHDPACLPAYPEKTVPHQCIHPNQILKADTAIPHPLPVRREMQKNALNFQMKLDPTK